jgi:hypothetical protein
MLAKKTFVICLTIIVCVYWQNILPSLGQSKTIAESRETSKKGLSDKTKAVKLLIATGREAQQLATAKNRVQAQTNVAVVLWKYDEAEARTVFEGALADLQIMFREVLAAGSASDVANENDFSYAKRAAFAELRNNYVLQLAAFDPKLALAILKSFESPAFGKDYDPLGAGNLELQIASIIIKKDPQQAFNVARQQLKKGFDYNLITTLTDMHKTDSELAAKLARETLENIKIAKTESGFESRKKSLEKAINALSNNQTVKSLPSAEETPEKTDISFVTAFFNMAAKLNRQAERQSDKKQSIVLTNEEMRELAEIITKAFLETNGDFLFLIAPSMPAITKYSPASAQLIRQKQKTEALLELDQLSNSFSFDSESDEKTLDELLTEADRASTTEERDLRLLTVVRKALNKDDAEKAVQIAERIKDKKAYDYLFEEIKAQVPLAQARRGDSKTVRKAIAAMKSETEKVKALTELIIALSAKNEREEALKLLDEAKTFLPSRLTRKTNLDSTLEIVTASSFIDTQTAFSMLENSVGQINDLIAASVLINEFYDYGAIENDELLFEAINRQSLSHVSRGISLINNLAAADFERTVNLADKFARPEIRLFVRLKIAEAMLDDEAAEREKQTRQQIENEYYAH